jgi:hypothetical protein
VFGWGKRLDFIVEAFTPFYILLTCPVCGVPFDKKKHRKQLHHSHIIPHERVTEANCYFGNRTICFGCNIGLKQMACVFGGHQINRLESHFILKSLSNRHMINTQVVCKNSETIPALSIGDCRLVDSANFMDYGLSELVRWLMC